MPDSEYFQVVVRFNEALGLPYKDGIGAELARVLPDGWPALATKFPGLSFRRVFEVDNPKRVAVAQRADDDAPSPYFVAELPDLAQARELVRQLRQLGADKVMEAFVRGRPTAADRGNNGPAPFRQGYLARAPQGIDAHAVWKTLGGRGEGVTLIDLERGWDLRHDGLPPRIQNSHVLFGENLEDKGHGTSVLGILVGRHEGGRIKGGAPDANVLLASFLRSKGTPEVASSIHQARTRLQRGDILLLEFTMKTDHNPDEPYPMAKAPAEVDPDVLDEIRNCTAKGILVVEPAGNDGKSLGPLRLEEKHSGALMVGAAAHTNGGARHWGKRPEFGCNYGGRVDCFAWGHEIATLDEGGKYREPPDGFGNTSGAAAIIAAAAVLLQSIARQHREAPLTPEEVRGFLSERSTGTRTMDHDKYPIGVMPDLNKVVKRLVGRPSVLDNIVSALFRPRTAVQKR